tara:strand:+ start:472 stop:879 length:408 start_codon:yes stop_codon:yes gene_type:complete
MPQLSAEQRQWNDDGAMAANKKDQEMDQLKIRISQGKTSVTLKLSIDSEDRRTYTGDIRFGVVVANYMRQVLTLEAGKKIDPNDQIGPEYLARRWLRDLEVSSVEGPEQVSKRPWSAVVKSSLKDYPVKQGKLRD